MRSVRPMTAAKRSQCFASPSETMSQRLSLASPMIWVWWFWRYSGPLSGWLSWSERASELHTVCRSNFDACTAFGCPKTTRRLVASGPTMARWNRSGLTVPA